jgi:aminoglycoside phosphotransferase family enzyme/predicted kinase
LHDHAAGRAMTTATLQIDELRSADAFAHPVSRVEIRETAISWIVLTGPYAYKIKKPVKLAYLDASTLALRLHYCREELRLNRRLAPELYLDVVPITRTDGRVRVGESDEPAIEYAVRMHQFDGREELSALLDRAAVLAADIVDLAEVLARFHIEAPHTPATSAPQHTEQLLQGVLDNVRQLLALRRHVEIPPYVDRLVDWTHEQARELAPLLGLREQAGWVRECHGDLHAANIVRHGGRLVPFDCIEFDPRLRWIDVVDDVAFLVMDLVSHEREDLTCAFLSRYLEVTGDYEGVRLLPFCAVHRALVRAKVDAIAAEQASVRRVELLGKLTRRVRTAIYWLQRPWPKLVLMHGLSGSGKSWLSGQLIEALPALRVRSDLERKRLAGIDATHRTAAAHREGIYARDMTQRTYARLLECAEACLAARFTVIVDASFLDAAQRESFRALALRTNVPMLIVSCNADPETLRRRIRARATENSDPSDADVQVLEAQLLEMQPLGATERTHALAIDTSDAGAVERALAAIAALR